MRALVWSVLLWLPSASALVLTDPGDDLRHEVQGQPVTPMETPHIDLVRLEVTETVDSLDVILERAEEPPDDPPYDAYVFSVYATHGKQAYRMVASHQDFTTPGAGFTGVNLYRVFEDGNQWVAYTMPEERGKEVSWSFPRDLFIDEAGGPPSKGRALTDVHATVSAGFTMVPVSGTPVGLVALTPWYRYDRVPDDGTGELPIVFGLEQRNAALASQVPYRASNGEAGRFYYRVNLTSHVADQVFTFRTTGMPAGWSLRLPFAELPLRAHETKEFLVEVTLPFAHAHGTTSSFTLIAEGADARGSVELGVHYVHPPQPSGHHSRIWIHSFYHASMTPDTFGLLSSRDGPGWPFMNTDENEPLDQQASIEPNQGTISIISLSGTYSTSWNIGLQPGLRMGLNMTGGLGAFELAFDSPVAHDDVRLAGSVVAATPDGGQVVATLEAAGRLQEGRTVFKGAIQGVPIVVPFHEGAALRLNLRLTSAAPPVHVQHLAPYLLPGGWIDLPLAEYKESIADASGFVPVAPSADEVAGFELEPVAESKESPGPSLVTALLAVAAVARRNRRV